MSMKNHKAKAMARLLKANEKRTRVAAQLIQFLQEKISSPAHTPDEHSRHSPLKYQKENDGSVAPIWKFLLLIHFRSSRFISACNGHADSALGDVKDGCYEQKASDAATRTDFRNSLKIAVGMEGTINEGYGTPGSHRKKNGRIHNYFGDVTDVNPFRKYSRFLLP